MDTRELAVFLAVSESLSFSRSAEQLHMSVSAVSRSVGRLETSLGQPLLERDRRSIRLTPAGRDCQAYARRALAEWQALRRRLGSEGGELAGEVSLYCSVTASHTLLAPILAAFRSAHPGVDIMMHTGDPADGVDRVLASRDDLAVTICPTDLPGRLDFLPLVDSPLVFCVPAAECQVRSAVQSGLQRGELDWSTVPLIVPERGTTQERLYEWLRERGVRPRIYAQVAGHEAIVAMVSLGLGVGIAPQLVIDASGVKDGVEILALEGALAPLSIGLVGLRQRLASPLVRALWDVAQQTDVGGV